MKKLSARLAARFAVLAVFGVALVWGLAPDSASAKTKDGKFLIYYSMSYVGNAWQTEAKNLITAMALLPEYADRVELRVQAAGANAARQIQQMNAMIQAGADAILAFPISPTALNGVIKNACKKGVAVVVINGVTEPCAYVVKVDGVKLGAYRTKFVVDKMGRKGNIVAITGVPGVSYSEEHHQGVKEEIARNPEVNMLAELVGFWSHSTARLKMRELLATHGWDEIDGIVVQTGCYTVSQMQVEDGWWPDHPIIPCAGESANGNRLQMLPVSSGIEGALGKDGQSIGSGLWAVGYTFRVAMRVLDGENVDHLIYYTGVEVTKDNVRLCETGSASEFAAGCNTIPPGAVPPDYAIDFWSPQVPELGFKAALHGIPDSFE
ncbi:MAG: substrate-binding domain-containing protein [Rhodospirillaceae bacterium]|jgi:ribose transport system substrate-binding protein|nr:substrate-binding domain-containing protein [Rhodospirillaceae bacterium]MBT5039762.1 substrate-binding domain-containing protein [Rhodospirillaceae bacterium]MBT5676922.1 substrate-binding domain-containing protein [Rhodospirillaceae bacterium]MBT5781062.1 substrate-binding domain-containing protein [Rhodospirillaceae bacterium]MBT7292410.1 substrate-binding domain-containing protein [Rhodospirillaceae bacterium]